MFRIGELAKCTGVSVETLRYYEQRNLLCKPQRSANGYRIYPEDSIKQVNFILKAKGLGFSLKDIVDLLSLSVTKQMHTCGDVKWLAQSKLAEIEQKINNLQQIQHTLIKIIGSCAGGDHPATECSILEALES